MIIIAGLGNPGPEYHNSRHNTGWRVADLVREELGFDDFTPAGKFASLLSQGAYGGKKVVILKPLTFMNLSGKAVSAILNFYKLDSSSLWVVYDDLDLPLGKIRIRKEGGPGSHNGMKSIIDHIGNSFPRFRVGIESRGLTAPAEQDTSSFVLDVFSKDEEKLMAPTRTKAAEAVALALGKDLDEAMNIYNV